MVPALRSHRQAGRWWRGPARVGVSVLLGALVAVGRPEPAEALAAYDRATVAVIRQTLPAVVSISVEKKSCGLFGPARKIEGMGTGLIVSKRGDVVTCAHVLGKSVVRRELLVTFFDGRVRLAHLIRSDLRMDLALLRAEPGPLPAVFPYSNLSEGLLGMTVLVLGSGMGYRNTVSRGILSSRPRRIDLPEGFALSLLQVDAPVNQGDSGAPVLDLEGKLVGLCFAKVAGLSVEGVGLVIAGPIVARWLDCQSVGGAHRPR